MCCNFKIDTASMKLPKYFPKESDLDFEDSEQFLIKKINEGLNSKIIGQVEDEQVYIDRIQTELNVIKAGGFIDYFLVLWDIMCFCKDNNILTGVGRGSAGGSLISYLLDIVYVDPIKYNLLFERFLNEGRFDSVPDIDCDFEGLRRHDVKRYMEQRFGIHSVASIGSYTTIKVKSGLKDIGRAMGYDHKEINIITSFLGDDMEGTGDDIMQLFKAAQVNKKLKDFVKNNVELVNTVLILMKNHRASSIHAAGVIIVPKYDSEGNEMKIYDWVPVRKDKDGILITEWEGVYLDKAKFVKEDILGIAQLDKWAYTLKLIKEHTGREINIHRDIPVDDIETYNMFATGFNDDVFQFGSDSQKSYSVEVKPENIEHLIAMNALYRPGPMESQAHVDFYKIKKGEKQPEIDTGMEDITGYTFGLWVYQEQLMLAYKMLTNCSMKEADDFRKMTAKFMHYKKVGMGMEEADKYYDNFIQNYISKFGVTEEYANKVWDKIIAFISYGFNRSHAVAYAITGYYCQYLKVHYPLQFWTTSLQFARENDIHKRISEINRSGQDIQLLPPEINKSALKFYSDVRTNKIYWSLDKIKYCGENAINLIIEEREKNGDFYSLEEFVKRVPKRNINKRTITYMILSGVFDEVADVLKVTDRIDLIKNHARLNKHEIDDMFIGPHIRDDFWWLIKQKEACGFGYIRYDKILKNNKYEDDYVSEIEFQNSYNTNKNVCIAGIVEFINKKKTRNGDAFIELKIEVNAETIFVTIWPEQYSKYKNMLDKCLGSIVLVNGVIDFNGYKKQNVLMTHSSTKIQIINID
jgi:DNA polymerase-3 subunit alpha